MVGIIKPTKGSGSLVELIEMLPDGIGIIPLFNNVLHGKIDEFQTATPLNQPEKFSILFPLVPN